MESLAISIYIAIPYLVLICLIVIYLIHVYKRASKNNNKNIAAPGKAFNSPDVCINPMSYDKIPTATSMCRMIGSPQNPSKK